MEHDHHLHQHHHFYEETLNDTMQNHHQHHHHHEDDIASVLTAKAVTMVTLCSVSMFMGIIPMQIAKCLRIDTSSTVANPRSSKWVGLLLGFGGGVLFCTTFIHMLPEVEEGVEHLMEEKILPHMHISLAKVFCCMGFFIMYLIEELVHAHIGTHKDHEKFKADPNLKNGSNVTIYSADSVGDYGSMVSAKFQKHNDSCELGHSHMKMIEDCNDLDGGAIRGLLIVLGLSVHELFEGLAIGLESHATDVWYLFGAVAAHKFIIAFCIGVELITSRTNSILCYVYVCMFAVVSPIGIGIGMILVGGGSAVASGPAAVILQGLASGTLLYVVFFEILHKHRNGLLQYLSILIGFAVMFGLQLATAHSHDHGHSHGHSQDHEDAHNHSIFETVTSSLSST